MSTDPHTDSAQLVFETRRLRYFVPFYLESGNAEQAACSLSAVHFTMPDGKTESLWIPCPFPLGSNQDIYRHIQVLMQACPDSPGQEHSVCRTFRFNMHYLFQRLENARSNPFVFLGKHELETPFSLNHIYLHLFSTGIGFLSYDAVVSGLSASGDLYAFQEQFKELFFSSKACAVRFVARFGDLPDKSAASLEEAEKKKRPGTLPQNCESLSFYNEHAHKYIIKYQVTLRLGEIIRWLLLKKACEDIRFFSTHFNNIPDKAVLMSYVTCEGANQAALRAAACRLARGYDGKYHISQNDLDACQPLYENVCCFASPEGCSIAVCSTADNRGFFVMNPPFSIYSFLFLLTLYQHYSLIRFSGRMMGDFPSDPEQYLRQTAYAQEMERLIAHINTHLMKSDFATVSYLRSHNQFYTFCQSALGIPQERQSLMSGFDYLVRLQSDLLRVRQEEQRRQEAEQQALARQRQEEQHMRETEAQEAKEQQLNWLITLLTIITFLGDGYAFVASLVDLIQKWRYGPTFTSIAVPSGFGFLLIFVACLYIKHIRSVKKKASRKAKNSK